MKRLSRFGKLLLLRAIRIYQLTASPLLRAATGQACLCRYTPSCSHYAADALKIHGLRRGLWLALNRISRCHPWGGFGHDPVPPVHSAGACTHSVAAADFSHHSHLKSDTKNVRS